MQKSKDEAKNRMEVDFLIAKSKVQRRKNISAIEVKSGKNYTLGSLSKYCEKYGQYIDVPYVLHSKDVKVENGITYLPLYMTPCL